MHSKGMAADIYVPDMSIAVLVDKIQSLHLPFDQLIDEFGRWVHVSHDPGRTKQRGETLRARVESGKTVYHLVKGI
jgi:zinc D-Ala-D-Ala carboxypeptidase